MTMWVGGFRYALNKKGIQYQMEIMDEGMFVLNKFCGLSE